MGIPNKDEVKGKYEETVGTVKEKVGHLTGDKEMEDQGADQRDAGEAQHQVAKIKRKVGEVIEDIGSFVRK